MKKKRALITGIGGQDGSYLTEHLLSKNYEVFGLLPRRSSPELQTNRIDHLLERINLSYGDVMDLSNLNHALKQIKPHEIYHLAAQSHVGVSFLSPTLTTEIDYLGTLNMLEALRLNCKNSKFYNASSSEMFGNMGKRNKLNEKSIMNPASPYAIAKLASYHITKIYRESYKIFAVNGILFNHESERRGLNFVTAKIVHGALSIKYNLKKKLELGNLDAARDWGYAGDYVKAMWLMLQQKKPIDLVIATGETKTVRDVCKYVFKKVGLKDYKKYIVTKKKFLRPNELHHLNGDSKLAKKKIGWKPTITFENLLDDMISNIEAKMFSKKN